MKNHNINCENTYNLTFSRARAYAHYKSFCFFAVTSVTVLSVIYWNLVRYRCLWSAF